MPKLTIDELEIEVPKGTKVIAAAEQLGIMIPRFCYLKSLGSVGACRMCAVKVLEGNPPGVQMSCMLDVQDGMVVSTTDAEVVDFRKHVIEWLMLNHPHDCPVCDEGGQCLLQDMTVSGGHGLRRFQGRKRTYRDQYLGVFIAHEMNRCIHCYRCSRFYQEFSGYRDLGVMQLGRRTFFGRSSDGQLENPFSGNLVDLCPTGVYTDKTARFRARRWDLQRSPSLCIQCSLGCNTIANARYREVLRIEGRQNDAVNGPFICDRGRFGFGYVNHPQRPRKAKIGGEEVSWEKAVRLAANRLAEVTAQAGPGGIACVGSLRTSLETQSLLARLCRLQKWRGPSHFLDSRLETRVRKAISRLDQRLAVSMQEIQQADCILVIGADPLNEAPMLALAMRQAFRNEAHVTVLDPRPVSLPFAFEHIAVAPGELETCLNVMVKKAVPPTQPEQLEAAAEQFYQLLPERYDADAAIDRQLTAVAERLAQSSKPVIICGSEVVSATTPLRAADHALLLQQIKGWAGLFYVMPGANAFGAAVTTEPGKDSFADLLEAIEAGSIKALLVVENDLLRQYADRPRLEKALAKLNLLLVLDYLPSATVERAHIFLPTATLYERGLSFVNQEGRIQFAQPPHAGGTPIMQTGAGSHPPRVYSGQIPGAEARPAWLALADLARVMSLPESSIMPANPLALNDGEHPVLSHMGQSDYPVDGLRIIADLSDRTFLPYPKSKQVPEAEGDSLQVILVDWIFGTEELASYAEPIGAIEPAPYASMHVTDGSRAGLSDGDQVVLQLGAGRSIEITLKLATNMAPGTLILPRHRQLDWQQLTDDAFRLPLNRITKGRSSD